MMCPRGKTPCALYGQQRKSTKLQWECVDILKDEESCEYPVQFMYSDAERGYANLHTCFQVADAQIRWISFHQ